MKNKFWNFVLRLLMVVCYPLIILDAASRPLRGMFYGRWRAIKYEVKKENKTWVHYWKNGLGADDE